MATSSIFHNIIIDIPEKAKLFADALEKAELFALKNKETYHIKVKSNRDMSKKEIKEFWESVVR